MRRVIVITGIGMVTPLGHDPPTLWQRMKAGNSAAAPPAHFDATPFACPVCAEVRDFQPQRYGSESKLVRLMNRQAQLAVAAAHLALEDAGLGGKRAYLPEEIGLFGATGLAGLALAEVLPLIKASTGADGRFDAGRFGRDGLKAVSPILSFKVLSNMPLCFVSICQNIQGPNAIYTPWEGQGAQAVEAAVRALEGGEARCALAGGCDVKTHALAFLGLEQQGAFSAWQKQRAGPVPGEGAAFLVLEEEGDAVARGARIHARLAGIGLATRRKGASGREACVETLEKLRRAVPRLGHPALPAWMNGAREIGRRPLTPARSPSEAERVPFRVREGYAAEAIPFDSSECLSLAAIVAAGNGDAQIEQDENQALATLQIDAARVVHPKKQMGDLFAAAAPVQIGLAAWLAARQGGRVLANCFGHGSEQAAFLLEPP